MYCAIVADVRISTRPIKYALDMDEMSETRSNRNILKIYQHISAEQRNENTHFRSRFTKLIRARACI